MRKGFDSFDTAVVDYGYPSVMGLSVVAGLADGWGLDNFLFDTEWEGVGSVSALFLFFAFLGWIGSNVADDWRGYD